MTQPTMFSYPVDLEPAEEGGFVVTFPGLPYGVTEGEDEEDALARAVDALETIMMGLMGDRQDVPPPPPANGRPTVTLPPISAAKVGLYQAMRESGIKKAELGRRLGWHMPQIDRLLDLRHTSRLDQLSAALRVVGKEIVLTIQDAT